MTWCDVYAVFGKRAELEKVNIFKNAISPFRIRHAVETGIFEGAIC